MVPLEPGCTMTPKISASFDRAYNAVMIMLLAREASLLVEVTAIIAEDIKWRHSWRVESIAESRDHIDGVCFEDIAGGFRVYNWNDKEHQYMLFDDLKQRTILDKILTFFGRKIVKPLKFGLRYGSTFYIDNHYVEREEFVDYLKDNYPDIFEWLLFNPELIDGR